MSHSSSATYIQTGKVTTSTSDHIGGRSAPHSAKTVKYNSGTLCNIDSKDDAGRVGIL